jgi:predicted DCC family thiol-disulfide oxidoreductase YuxK
LTKIILFDGVCQFCDRSVQFIIKRDKKGHFKFASLQSDLAKQLLSQYNVAKDVDSLVLLDGNNYYIKSTAALRICKNLSGFWKLGYLLLVIPRPFRDFVYQLIAKNRYNWFGKKEACTIPSPEMRKRFL